MQRVWWTAPAALIVGVAAAGALACDDCTDAGCSSGASVLIPSLDVPRAVYTVRVCVDGACATQRMELLGNATADELRGPATSPSLNGRSKLMKARPSESI